MWFIYVTDLNFEKGANPMATQDLKRKLTAILSADVVGYSRLMEEDEAATVKSLTAYRETISSLIQQHRGRVVDSPGDNLLAEFASVVDAVQCAVETQELLKAKNAELPEGRRMQFRFGINLGDVIEEGARIYGDGVNIAARIEAMADPGGICISMSVYNQIKKKLVLDYEDLGEHTVKNISEPIRVYRVPLEREAVAVRVGTVKKAKVRRWQWAAIGGAVVIIIVVGTLVIQNYLSRPAPIEPASAEKMAHSLPDKPSYAVLPFVNIGKDPDLEYLCDGITETIITTLSKNPYIFVIASNSSFTYKGKSVKVNKVAEELGVQYVIEGSVQKSGDRLRIAVQLIDALTGRHIWSERFDRTLKDLFKLQDEIVLEILKSTQISDTMIAKTKSWRVRGGTNSIDAQLKFFEAMHNYRHRTKNYLIKAKQLFEEAITIDPNFALPHAMLGFAYHHLGHYYTSGETSRNNIENGLKSAKKAIELDNTLSTAYDVLGVYYQSQRKYDMAVTAYKKAIELEPADPWAHHSMARTFLWIYRLEESLYHHKESIRLNPLEPVYYIDFGRTYFHLRQYEDAIRTHKKVIELMQRVPSPPWWPHLHLAMVYSEFGRDEEARAHMKKLLEFFPKFNLEDRRKAIFFEDPANTEREIEALRKAGAPEHPPS